jgi:hypothetical protein
MAAGLLASPQSALASSANTVLQNTDCILGTDFNRDGKADRGIIASVHGLAVIRLSLSGRREPLDLRAGTTKVLGVVAADVDRDGNTDIVALKKNLRVRVWLNKGHGHFVRKKPLPGGIFLGNGIVSHRENEPVSAFVCPEERDEDLSCSSLADPVSVSAPQVAHGKPATFFTPQTQEVFLSCSGSRGPPVNPL